MVHVLFDHIIEAIICDENQIFLLGDVSNIYEAMFLIQKHNMSICSYHSYDCFFIISGIVTIFLRYDPPYCHINK